MLFGRTWAKRKIHFSTLRWYYPNNIMICIYFCYETLFYFVLYYIKRIYWVNEDERQDVLDTSSTFYVNVLCSFSFTSCKKRSLIDFGAHGNTKFELCVHKCYVLNISKTFTGKERVVGNEEHTVLLAAKTSQTSPTATSSPSDCLQQQ